MSEWIPTEGLSEHFAARMDGRRLVAALFTTFQLDPGFFEQEVLPVFIDSTFSHATAVRLLQLEAALRGVEHGVAVYYDANGLVPSDAGSPKLDVARIPLRNRHGVFHAKNVLLLTEPLEDDESGERPRSLIVACLSANLTRSGWWQNVEVAHIEEMVERGASRMRTDLLHFLHLLRQQAPKGADHRAQEAIRKFLVRTETQSRRVDGQGFRTHLWSGKDGDLVDFLEATAGRRLDGLSMEIISPFFGPGETSVPLARLLAAFRPKACRVFLPRTNDGTALVDERLYAWLRDQPDCSWGTLPGAITSLGRAKDAGHRFVHAKVIRFFSQRPKTELLLIGSPNLTAAAHLKGGNVETAFLVEVEPERKHDFWLEEEGRNATRFAATDSSSDAATSGGSCLSLRFDWSKTEAFAHWSASFASPRLTLSAHGAPLFELSALAPDTWTALDSDANDRLKSTLAHTALIDVEGDGEDGGRVLVQEEGMHARPLLLQLSAADILRYWSMLTDAQRTAFIEARASDLMLVAGGADLIANCRALQSDGGMFDRFAGFFHAFATLTRAVRQSFENGHDREAIYRLFGRNYDSLGTLLERISTTSEEPGSLHDPVDRYLIALCASQLVTWVKREQPDFWQRHADEARGLESLLGVSLAVRVDVLRDHPERDAFLRWYEGQFLTAAV